jgi:tetratricopeptide (TPR) repeat protein
MRAIHSPLAAKSDAHFYFTKGLSLAILSLVIFCVPLAVLAQNTNSAKVGQNQTVESEAFLIRSFSQYELVKLYLKNGEIEKAYSAARQILQPSIPPEYEPTVVKSMRQIADMLKDVRRFDLAQSLLDESLKVLVQIPGRVEILQKKAGLYFLSGENDKAIEAWKRAEAEGKRRDGNFF